MTHNISHTRQSEKSRWLTLVYFWSSCLSLFVFPIGLLLPRDIYRAAMEFAFMPFWIPLIGIIMQPGYRPTIVLSTIWGLTPAIGNAIYTTAALLIVNYLFRGAPLNLEERRYLGKLRIASALFILVDGIYCIVEIQR